MAAASQDPVTAGRECYHCKQWIAAGQEHDCWTTTEAALTRDLPEDLRDAWERLRETAAALGDQRIYASHNSIMFSRASCYCFVRPKRSYLEVCVFLPREVRGPQVRRVDRVSAAKLAHLLRVTHRDEVEAPLTGWLRDAYDFSAVKIVARQRVPARSKATRAKKAAKTKARTRSKAKPRRS